MSRKLETMAERDETEILARVADRVREIMESADDRDRRGLALALDLHARLRLDGPGAVRFQMASAILREIGGLREDQVVRELIGLGLEAVLRATSQAARERGIETDIPAEAPCFRLPERALPPLYDDGALTRGGRVLN